MNWELRRDDVEGGGVSLGLNSSAGRAGSCDVCPGPDEAKLPSPPLYQVGNGAGYPSPKLV